MPLTPVVTRAMRAVIGLAVAAALGAAGFASPRQIPAAGPGDGLVRAVVAVERDDGTSVAGLGPEDFEVVSDGQACGIEYFSAADEPVALILLVDVSASNPIPMDVLEGAAEGALLQRRTPPDRVRVGGLAATLSLSPRFATDARELRREVRTQLSPRDADRFGPSPLWDGVEAAVKTLETERCRRAIVMVTDGRSTGNVHSADYAALHAIVADVSISILGAPAEMILRQTETMAARVRPGVMLEQVAAATGGAYADIRRSMDVAPLLARAVTQLHQAYTIGFPPVARDGRGHVLQVRVKRPGMKARAKMAYVADVPLRIAPGSQERTPR